MVRALAAAAVFHGVPRLLIEDDAEEEDKGTLGVGKKVKKGRESGKPTESKPVRLIWEGSHGLTCRQLNPANR